MQIKNYTNKSITEFNSEDTLYMQKIISGFMYTFLIKFKSFNKNIVTGEILDIQPNNTKSIWIKDKLYSIGDDISGQITKCFTYDNRCCWFKKDNKNYNC